ncbi:MAG TPA: ATP-binding protein [Candidatus Acidoferrum sp.]|nr:ATP-binding protein [Candidatus Acidoferrum sp.]
MATELYDDYRSLFENMQEGVAHCQMLLEDGRPQDFVYLAVNGAFEKLTGLRGVVGKKASELMPGIRQSDAELLETYWRVALNGQPERFETFVVALNHWFSISVYSPAKEHFVAVFDVITERKRAEEALRLSEAELAEAQRLAKYGNWTWDITDNRLNWSDELYRIFGVEKGKLGRTYESFFERVEPGDREAVRETNRMALTEGKPFEIVYGIITPQGEKRVIRELGCAIRNQAGKVARLFGTAQDITAQSRTEAELRWKTAFLEAQTNSTLDGILVVNREGKQILQNQRMLELWKIPPELSTGNNDRAQLEFVLGRVKNSRAFIEKVEHLYAHPNEVSRDEIELTDGTILDRYSSPVVGKDGAQYGRIWTFRDITEQRRLEAQFRQSQKMEAIGQLAGGVAHDFNNMLAVIRGNADLLLMDSDTLTPLATECLQHVVGASESAANLTRQLLIFSRKEMMQLQPLALNEVLMNLAKMLKRIIRENIRLEYAYAEPAPFVLADAGMLEQVLLNLVVNARDAMPQGGQVRIATDRVSLDKGATHGKSEARVGEFVRLSVSDTGTGIAPENLSRIFEPFFTTKEPGKGTGLGLATVFGIVQKHQGWLEVSSLVGKGTTFNVFLPTIPPPAATGAAQPTEAKHCRGTETILLVEDDLAVRMTARRVLETHGYKVFEAGYGREALDIWKVKGGEIALLVSDMMMPEGVTGRDLADQLRAQRPGLKVIFVSGYSAEIVGKETAFFRRTKSTFLHKPYKMTTLVQTVRQCLDEK